MTDAKRRFFVEPSVLSGDEVAITGDLAHRLARVLRYRPGDEVVLATGDERESVVRLELVSPKGVAGLVVGTQAAPREPSVVVTLYQSLIRPNRFDYALEKGTEIGVSRFVPVVCEHTQVQEEPGATRAERWRRVIVEAAEQCGRGRLPEVKSPVPFAEALASAPGLSIVPWEDERATLLAEYLRSLDGAPDEVSLFVGPEGGYSGAEIDAAKAAGAVLVTLGRRVLRSETAAAVACGIVLHELDR